MTNGLRNTVSAELCKLGTLPAVLITIAATVLGTAGLAAVLVNAPFDEPLSPVAAALRGVEYAQIGLIVLGVLAIASEYAGSQARTSLTAVPGRLLLLTGKVTAYLLAATLTALLAVAAALAGAIAVKGGQVSGGDVVLLLRAAAYLVLIGLLAHAVATLTRDAIGALAVALALVLVLPPILSGLTTLARYLPGAAGARMYQTGAGLSPYEGGFVLAAWLALTLTAAALSFTRRDA